MRSGLVNTNRGTVRSVCALRTWIVHFLITELESFLKLKLIGSEKHNTWLVWKQWHKNFREKGIDSSSGMNDNSRSCYLSISLPLSHLACVIYVSCNKKCKRLNKYKLKHFNWLLINITFEMTYKSCLLFWIPQNSNWHKKKKKNRFRSDPTGMFITGYTECRFQQQPALGRNLWM